MRVQTRRISTIAVAALLAGCAARPPFAPPLRDTRPVEIHNPDHLRLELVAVVPGGFRDLDDGHVGEHERIRFDVHGGRYALRIWPLRAGEPIRYVALPVFAESPRPSRSDSDITDVDVDHTVRTIVRRFPEPDPGWCWIPPGIALIGDDLGVGQEDERPASTPQVAGFWLAERETTNAEFVAFLNAIGRPKVDERWLDLDGRKCRVQWDDANRRFATDAPKLPVVTVSWAGANAYCRWRSETSGVRHRLPTEVEWEKAARGPGSRVYAYGDVCRTEAANQESGRLREVGQFQPNGFGLYDMTANAFEWCSDAYSRTTYSGGSVKDTPDALRVLRGGSYVLDGIFCRNSMRMRLRPDVRADDVGFRVLREKRADSE